MTYEGKKSGEVTRVAGRLALFLVVLGILGWLSTVVFFQTHVTIPMTRAATYGSRVLINVLGGAVENKGTVLVGQKTSLDILDGCNGVIAMIIYAGAVLVHRAPATSKIAGLLGGLTLIWIINLARIVSLYAVAVTLPSQLEFFHIYFWQSLIILIVAVIWYAWAARVHAPQKATESGTG